MASTASRVLKNTTVLSLGSLVSLITGTIFISLLSRHIGPAGYGQYAFARSTVALLMIPVNFGFRGLTIRNVAQERDQSSRYLSNILFLKILIAIIVFTAYALISLLFNAEFDIIQLILLVGAAAILESLINTIGTIFLAFERMEYDTATQVFRSIIALALTATAIAMGFDLLQIVALLVLAMTLRGALSYYLLSRKILPVNLNIDLPFSKSIIIASVPFALLASVNILASNVGIVMLRSLAGDTPAGWYAAAIRVIAILEIIPAMFLTSIYPVMARFSATSKDRLESSYKRSYELGLLIGLPMGTGLFLVADQIINLIFGPGFEAASIALKILAVPITYSFCNSINGATMNALGQEKLFAAVSSVAVLVVIVLNLVLIPHLSFVAIAITQVLGTGFGFIFYSMLVHYWLDIRFPWRRISKIVLATTAMAVCVSVARRSGLNLLLIVSLIGPLSFAAGVFLLGAVSTEDMRLLKKAIRIGK